ncbi:CopG family transcriptional regulator [Burkholderia sp. WAC0059]|uniref:type II toxin-antitoxin system TacA family antitoxin n=1 Tax=Burkholderia sp. WAC0059 TaxID=2066022 RepID=UPI000C7EE07A|nr:DUF1778 domain-containing protein [Burkholderia sp. WAC0059]PLY99933.1 CopG family transcriptional regulator [Burkholderia sp. WAC0059]
MSDTPKWESLNLRISAETRSLIDRAAAAKSLTRTEFILGAARAAAEDTLHESSLLHASPEAFTAFCAALDAPPSPNEHLVRLMSRVPAWAQRNAQ